MVDNTPISFYQTPNNQPINALQMMGQYQGLQNAQVQNQLLQQNVQQQQMNTKQQQDNQKFDAYLSQQQQANPSGSPDPNAVGSWLATNAPLAYGRYQDWKNGRLALTPQGVDPQTGAAISKPLQEQQAEFSTPSSSQGGQTNNGNAAPTSHTVQTGLAPGVQSAADLDVKNANAFETQVQNSGNTVASLKQAKSALAGVSASGPKSDMINQMKSLALTLSPNLASAAGVNLDSVNSFDEARKLLNRAATDSGTFNNTDYQLLNTLDSNANLNMQKGAINSIINGNLGRLYKSQAMNEDWQKAKKQSLPPTFGSFSLPWQNVDPNAFAMHERTPQEAATIASNAKANSQTADNFRKSLAIARAHNFSNPPENNSAGNE